MRRTRQNRSHHRTPQEMEKGVTANVITQGVLQTMAPSALLRSPLGEELWLSESHHSVGDHGKVGLSQFRPGPE